MLGSRAETRAPRPIPSEPLSPRSFSWEDPGIPEAMQDPEQGSVPQGSEQRQVPLPAAPGPPLLSFLLPAGWVILALEPRTFQKADRGVAQGRGAAECASREGAGWAGAPLPCSHPQRALIQMLQWAAGRPHPGITPATYPPGPKGSPGGVTAQRPQQLRGGDREDGALCMIRFQSFLIWSEREA